MQINQKKTQKPKPVSKPFLRGKPLEKTCIRSVFAILATMMIVMLGFTILGGMLAWDNLFLRVVCNGALLAVTYMIYYNAGANRGTQGVSQGEILYQRRETGRPVEKWELERAFHPAKGFLIGLLGCLPMVLCGVALAFVAQRQMTTAGALPQWVSGMNRAEVTGALAAYQREVSLTVEDILRLIIRMSLLPMVNIVGSEAKESVLLLERLSALPLLLPGLSYGLGYLRGVAVRASIHGNIEAGKKLQAKRARKARKARTAAKSNKPEQLN